MTFRTSIVTVGALITLALPAAANAGFLIGGDAGANTRTTGTTKTLSPRKSGQHRVVAKSHPAKPGGFVKDKAGGYYDAAHSTYIVG